MRLNGENIPQRLTCICWCQVVLSSHYWHRTLASGIHPPSLPVLPKQQLYGPFPCVLLCTVKPLHSPASLSRHSPGSEDITVNCAALSLYALLQLLHAPHQQANSQGAKNSAQNYGPSHDQKDIRALSSIGGRRTEHPLAFSNRRDQEANLAPGDHGATHDGGRID